MTPNKISLIGMPSAGKTTVGKSLATKLGYKVMDLDDMVEEKEGKTLITVLEEKGGKYFLDMFDAMTSARLLMRKGANAFYVVGNNSTMLDNEKLLIPTDEFLYELGKYAGWTPHKMIPMELLSSRDIFKDNRGSSETILWFKA